MPKKLSKGGKKAVDEKSTNSQNVEDEDELDFFVDGDEESGDDETDNKEIDVKIKDLEKKIEDQAKQYNSIIEHQRTLLEQARTKEESSKDEKPALPEFPEPPADFDVAASYVEPTSTSYKYRVAYDQVRAERDRIQREIERKEYLNSIVGYIDKVVTANKQRSDVEQMEKELANKRGLDDKTVNDFKSFLMNTKSLTMDELFNVYAKRTGIKTEEDTDEKSLPGFNDFTSHKNR